MKGIILSGRFWYTPVSIDESYEQAALTYL